jgi:hypothetical protein
MPGLASKRPNGLRLFSWLCLGVSFVLVSSVLFNEYRFSFHSDGGIKTVLARLAFDEGRVIPRQWIYANGDLFLVGPQVFSILLFPWFGVSYFSNASADWLSYAFLTLAVYGACRSLAPDKPLAAVVGVTLAAGGLSAANFEFVIGQGSYAIYTGLALALFSLISRSSSGVDHGQSRTTSVLVLAAAALVCISNASRGDITIIAPLLAGWFASILFFPVVNQGGRVSRLRNPVIVALIVGAIAGTLIYKYWLMPGMFNFQAAARLGLASKAEMWAHLCALPGAWFDYFLVGGHWGAITPLLRILQGSVWGISIALLLAPAWIVLRPLKYGFAQVTMSWIVLACYATSFLALVVSAQLFTSILELRYATFPIYGSVCVLAILLSDWTDRGYRAGTLCSLGVVFVALLISAQWARARNPELHDMAGSYEERIALIEALKERDIGTVLTPYWYSHVLTVLSGGEVDAYPVSIGTRLSPFAHHMPKRVFYGSAGHLQAVVLPKEEISAAIEAGIVRQFGEPVAQQVLGNFKVWIYDHDIVRAVIDNPYELNKAVSPDQVMMRISQAEFERCAGPGSCSISVKVTNEGHQALSSMGNLPLRLGIEGIDAAGKIVVQDQGRADFPSVIESHGSQQVEIELDPPASPAVAKYRVCLLQESVAWLCDRTRSP